MTTIRDEIAKNLLFYRKKAHLTQKELAEKLGVKNTAVSNWESGNNSIDIDTLFKACEIFGITLNDIYGKYSAEKTPAPESGLSKARQALLDAIDGMSEDEIYHLIDVISAVKGMRK